MTMQPIEVLLRVTDSLEALGIIYCIDGSFASSAYGEPRATRDADILVDLSANRATALVAQLEPDFSIQLEAVYQKPSRAPPALAARVN